jgi:putative secretion ATPase (PEP-CTERM system associated)
MFDDFYGLKGRPFQLTPDPAFYFESLTHRKALSYLGYGLAQGEGFVVITGEVGSGKSTLVAHLMSTIDPARLTAAQVVTSKLDGEELVHVVAQSFGLLIEGHDKATALGAIESFLHEEARAGRRCLLIVDESQNLTIGALEELRMLSNFQLGSHPLLQTLLLGQPEFRETLHDHPELEQLRQRVIAAHHLEAMESTEVQPYIEHRMRCVGWDGNPAFDQRVFAEIYTASGGVPRRINQIANRLLLLGAVDKRTRIDAAMLGQVLSELTEDGTLSLHRKVNVTPPAAAQPASPVPAPAPVAQPAEQAQATARSDIADVAALARIEGALAQRDAQISELQHAVLELANANEAAVSAQEAGQASSGGIDQSHLAEFAQRLETLEGRMLEQDRTIRHTLTMLIEWIEAGDTQRVAA